MGPLREFEDKITRNMLLYCAEDNKRNREAFIGAESYDWWEFLQVKGKVAMFKK